MQRTAMLGALLAQLKETDGRGFFRKKRRGELLLADFLEPERLAFVFAAYGRRYGPQAPLVAVAGEWSKRYFARVMRPVAIAAMMLDWRMPFSPESISIDVNDDGDIVSLGLTSFGSPVAITSAEERFDFLLRDNVAVVVHAIAQASGLSRNVLWSNAGNVFDGIARSGAMPSGSGVSDAMELLEKPFLLDRARNPLYRPIAYSDCFERSTRTRRVCCIRYLLDTLDYCATCPCSVQSRRSFGHGR